MFVFLLFVGGFRSRVVGGDGEEIGFFSQRRRCHDIYLSVSIVQDNGNVWRKE